MHPTLILLIGIATILAGIVVLRLNAFLALIIAAIVVSLLAPGEAAVKIARVAEGFRRTAGTLGRVIALGATHTLVPPTPGPLAIAGTLGVDLGTMVLVGAVVALPAAAAGLLFAGWLDRRMPVVPAASTAPGVSAAAVAPTAPLPGLIPSLLPILLPVLLISSHTVVASMTARPGMHVAMWSTLEPYTAIIGNPNLALLVGTGIAMWVYARQRRACWPQCCRRAACRFTACMSPPLSRAGRSSGRG